MFGFLCNKVLLTDLAFLKFFFTKTILPSQMAPLPPPFSLFSFLPFPPSIISLFWKREEEFFVHKNFLPPSFQKGSDWIPPLADKGPTSRPSALIPPLLPPSPFATPLTIKGVGSIWLYYARNPRGVKVGVHYIACHQGKKIRKPQHPGFPRGPPPWY